MGWEEDEKKRGEEQEDDTIVYFICQKWAMLHSQAAGTHFLKRLCGWFNLHHLIMKHLRSSINKLDFSSYLETASGQTVYMFDHSL